MNNYTKYPRGSEWRKWDLHIHTKGTMKNDNFSSTRFDEFCNQLFRKAIDSEIFAIGITDYFNIENYKKVKEFIENIDDSEIFDTTDKEFIKNIFVLPNVELRMLPTTDKGRLVNIHCIFNPDFVEHLGNNFFGAIKCSGGSGVLHPMNHKGLIDHGKSMDESLEDNEAYKKGIDHFVVSHESLQKLYDENANFRDNTLIVVSNSNNDGASAFNKHYDLFENEQSSSLDAVRQAIYKLSHCIFSPNENDFKYFLGDKADDVKTVIKKCGSLKPCIHGSDAHTEEKLFKPDENRFCWIKADLTFEGLKQIVYEPADRVRIQSLKPHPKQDRNVISEIEFIDRKDNIFGNRKILLNDNLNAIIGGKSSGKSLMLYSIANSIDPEQVRKTSERLKFEGYSKFDFDFNAIWKNGETDILSENDTANKKHKITYIPQLYINHLVEKNNKEDLNELIKNILFQDADFKQFYISKNKELSNLTEDIDSLITSYLSTRVRLIDLSNQKSEVGNPEAIKKGLEQLQKSIEDGRKLSTLSEEEYNNYTQLQNSKNEIERKQKILKEKEDVLTDIKNQINTTGIDLFGDNSPFSVKGSIDRALDELSVLTDDVSQLKTNLITDYNTLSQNLENNIKAIEIEKARNELIKVLEDCLKNLAPFTKKLEGQKELKKVAEALGKEQRKLQTALSIEKQFNTNVNEYGQIRKRISNSLEERIRIYGSIVQKINESKNEIGSDILLNTSLIIKKTNFSLYEQANKTAIARDDYFNTLFQDELVKFDMIPDLFAKFLRVHEHELTDGQDLKIPLRQGISLEEVLRGLVADNFQLDFNVTYNEDDLLFMSPRKKGTVLLILFLQISSSEYPILIDQPEDNLDNRTIYDLLCQMIKKKKKERQIIIVSHNVNLVVATDTENVIVANQEGLDFIKETGHSKFGYVNGALEHTFISNENQPDILLKQGIREHVCDILEGGEEAFKQRERKYALK